MFSPLLSARGRRRHNDSALHGRTTFRTSFHVGRAHANTRTHDSANFGPPAATGHPHGRRAPSPDHSAGAAVGRRRRRRHVLLECRTGDGSTGRERRRLSGSAGRQNQQAGHRVRRRSPAHQDRFPRLDVLGHTVRPAAAGRPAFRAARNRPATRVARAPQRVRSHARLHPVPAGPAASRPPAVRQHRRTARRPDPDVRGLSVPERLQARRYGET